MFQRIGISADPKAANKSRYIPCLHIPSALGVLIVKVQIPHLLAIRDWCVLGILNKIGFICICSVQCVNEELTIS